MRAVAIALVLGLGIALSPTVTGATEPDTAELKRQADAAFDARRFADALAQYEVVLARGGGAKIRYNIAQTLTALERYPEALASYQSFLAEASPGTLNAAQQERFFVLLDELKGRIARLDIRCDVPGARVLVRDKAVGATPLAGPVAVNAGPAKIEVLADGFKPFVVQTDLPGGQTQAVTVPLERIDFMGRLSVDSGGVVARVRVDGADRGTTPVVLRLDQGTHVAVLHASGFVDEARTVAVRPGEQTDLSVSLSRSPDYTLAYSGFAAGAVGIVAGSVTGVLAFTTLSSAKAQCDTMTSSCGPAGQPDLQTSKTFGVISTVAFVVGGAGVGAGVLGLVLARHAPARERAVGILLSPSKLELVGTF